MKLPIIFSLAIGFSSLASNISAAADTPFPQSDLMRIGVYYYPEAWPSNQWARDIANIKKMNLEFVHMGEFAWAFMEPQEGKFNFDWLEQNVKLCTDQGLKVVLCTPSPTPPVWLTQKYPEVCMVDASGRRMLHGTRQQACWSVEKYREMIGKIDDELGKRFGNDPRVWGWQLDNELSHYGKEPCYCDACQTKFRAWLKNKYGTIEKLNDDWGNAFWSQMYQNFDQIRIPNKAELVAQLNEHALLDAQRWFADEAADYLRFQAGVLRKHCGKRQWITSNFMHMFNAVNPALNENDFEIITWTHYPAHGNLNDGPLGFRLGGAAEMSFSHDFHRSINGFEGLMELQPGQVNWGDVNPQPYPGAIHMWIMRAFAANAKIVCTYRYRQPLFGAEQYHYGLVGTDGITLSPGGEEYSKAAQEISELRKKFDPQRKEPAAYAARRAALLYNVESRWDLDDHKQTVRWDTMGHILKSYRALKRVGAPVDVITEEKDFSKYPFLIVPAVQLVDEKLVQRWKTYAENGGHLILTCRTGMKDRRGHLWEGPWAMPILDLIGAKIKFYDTLPAPRSGHVTATGTTHEWTSWAEVLEPDSDTTVIAYHADQFYLNKPAAVTRKLGKGTVTYIGVDSSNGTLEAQLIRDVYDRAGVAIENFPDGFLVDWRDGFWVATNFTERTQHAPAGKDAKFSVGYSEVPIAGVSVWQE
jgi:beta-galactosidase